MKKFGVKDQAFGSSTTIYDEAGPQPSSLSADQPRLEKNRTLREPEINSNAVYPMTQNGRNLFVMH
jgi:hypothetical protein